MSDQITPSSGNVFNDLGLPQPEEDLVKAELARVISAIITAKGWNQTEAAAVLGLDQPKVSNLLRGRLAAFSVDRLLVLLTRLGRSVDVRVSAEEVQPADASIQVRMAA